MNTELNTFDYNLKEAAPLASPEGRKWLMDHLKISTIRVRFIKTDGTERTMNCTLDERVVPALEKKTDKVKALNEDVLPVYDVDAKGWRSFRLDSILTISFDL